MADHPKRGVLLGLAAEGIVPVLGGCAGALAVGPEGGLAGAMVGVAVEKVINFFGARIVERWAGWFRTQPPEVREQALAELAALPAEEARKQAEELLDQLTVEPVSDADRATAVNYLSLLPGSLDRALPRDAGGGRSLPATLSVEEPQQLLSLLPINLPPYAVGTEVPGTPYRLEGLLGSGGFGAVYRASTRSLQHLPLAVKFCLDPALAVALNRERANLERLMKAGGENWSPRVVRLYGYDLEHATPYLVYEFVTGGDLIRYIAERRQKLGRALNAGEVYDLVVQVAEALAFAHEHGLVHRDLKPANVLVEGGVLKLADFGLGGVNAVRAAHVSRIGATTVDQLSIADQASLFRGAGTPLYMAPEQRRGNPPDPRHDLFSLGVMWYQLLIGDVSRELHPGWAKELSVRYGVPKAHINLIEACVGWFEERPKHAGELLEQMRGLRDEPAAPVIAPPPTVLQVTQDTDVPKAAVTRLAAPADDMREALLNSLLKQTKETHERLASFEEGDGRRFLVGLCVAGVAFIISVSIMHTVIPSILLGLALGAVTTGTLFAGRYQMRSETQAKLVSTTKALSQEFPDIVRCWGGESVLKNADLVAEILLKRNPPREPPKPASAPSFLVAPEKRAGLLTLLNQALAKRKQTTQHGRPLPFPLASAVVAAVVVGALFGLWVGMTLAGYFSPAVVRVDFQETYLSFLGRTLDQPGYLLESRRTMTIAVGSGILSGIFVALISFGLLRRPWYRLSLLTGLVAGLVVAMAAGLGVGFLLGNLISPYLVRDQFGFTKSYHSALGRTMTREDYEVSSRQMTTTAALSGIGAGVLALMITAFLVHRHAAKSVREAQKELDYCQFQLESEYTQVVPLGHEKQWLGGKGVLEGMINEVEGGTLPMIANVEGTLQRPS